MTKRFRFTTRSRESAAVLHSRIVYLSNAEARTHAEKQIVIRPARNRFCADPRSGEAFKEKLLRGRECYREARTGRRGKSTSKLYEEFCYSPPVAAELAAEERELIEEVILKKVCAFVATRSAWHSNVSTGRDDLHILCGAYTDDWPPRVHTAHEYGNGRQNLLLALERAEAEGLYQINSRRSPERRILSAREIRLRRMKLAKGKKLAERLQGRWDGCRETLAAVLRQLGYVIEKMTAKIVEVISPHAQTERGRRPRRYNIDTLRQEMGASGVKRTDKRSDDSGFEMA